MECEVEELPANHNLKCHVCGENQFDEREGFYYCQECGTKQEQLRQVEIERDDEFNPEKLKTRRQKIHVAKDDKRKCRENFRRVKKQFPTIYRTYIFIDNAAQLTSWECYNYILRGFVEELLSFGAKEELKLMTLQVWAAYLRRMEVAFFNRKQPDLPKFGVIYLHNDAETIYNHAKKVRSRRRRSRSEDTICSSRDERSDRRQWNRSKRQLDESNYSLTSASGVSGLTSSTSANSNKAIKIDFSAKARAYFKRKMPVKHLEKHQSDYDGLLTCHKQPKTRQINRADYNLMSVNIKQVYSILGIALNLIDDDIQLCDLIRFINEGHIGTSNVLQYFPENIASNGKDMLKKINFYKYPEKYSDKALRDHIGLLCKNIGIHTLQTPDMIKLIQRYTTELCLPKEFADYIERLINFLPPNFKTRTAGTYPGFEARAMAYIIFTLKLLFGLDDSKEYRMSRASQKLNSKISQLNSRSQEKQPLLFVWDEWVEYIEMRKVIISQCNTSFCEQFKQSQSINLVLDQMAEEMRRTEETNNLLNDTSENLNFTQKLKTFRSLFERFQETYKPSENDNKSPARIEFTPSLTPALSYLKNILIFNERETNTNSSINIKIPDFMHIDHSQRDINSYLQVKPLIKYFEKHQLKLKVHVIGTSKNIEYIGIFRTPRPYKPKSILYKACFDVTEEEWGEAVKAGYAEKADDLEFITDFKPSSAKYMKRKKSKSKRKPFCNPHMNYDLTTPQEGTDNQGDNESMQNTNLNANNLRRRQNKATLKAETEDLQTMCSFELFSENNMDPIIRKDFITKPRRNLGNIDIFEGISDEESVLNSDDGDDDKISDDPESAVLNGNDTLPSSPISVEFIKKETNSSNNSGLQTPSERNNALHLYISNMDCWMILGCILNINKAQKCQLQGKFTRSFNWLLETCAQTINVEWSAVFEQLLCIETMFCLGINEADSTKNCIYLNSHNSNKDFQSIISLYRAIW